MAFNPELGSTSPAVLLDNAERLDKLVNGPAADVPDRGGDPLYSWRQMMAKNDEIRQNLIPLSRQYMTLADAQADIANIPEGSATYVRSSDGITLADEYLNNSGVLVATGRVMISKGYIDDLASRGLISTELDDGLDIVDVEYDPVSMRMSKFTMRDGRVFIPLLQLSENAVAGNNIQNGSVSSEKLSLDVQSILSQELDPDTGFSEINYDPVTRRM
ncbi:TPA: hypothetical protein ACPUFQ_005544, partial [Klebsiella pneumoniae]